MKRISELLPMFVTTLFVLLFSSTHCSSTTTTTTTPLSPLLNPTPTPSTPLRIAYQGEPGAYSEKSVRELLGPNVITVGRPDFESCYQAVLNGECDYALLPVENSLGGSIHENYDLMLRYDDLTIVAEHEFRVKHCLLVKEGVVLKDVKFAISHPQALAQCDGYLRSLGIERRPVYDTAGAAKLISENKKKRLPDGCTPENTAAVASDLAGTTYGLNCLEEGIEDDDSNFTRFLLLGHRRRQNDLLSQNVHVSKSVPAKTSIVFTLPNTAGALYKALACFSLREIDFTKIESRPTSASLLSVLRFKMSRSGLSHRDKSKTKQNLPRFRYCFYLDFLANEMDEMAQNALHHLREQADFVRVLGCYPTKSRLVGPLKDAVEALKGREGTLSQRELSITELPGDEEERTTQRLKIGIVGFGTLGRFLAQKMVQLGHQVSCTDVADKSQEAEELDVEYHPSYSLHAFLQNVDVVLLSVPLIHFQDIIESQLPLELLKHKLVVEVCPLSSHPKSVLLSHLLPETDIISAMALFGPQSSDSWDGQPVLYEKVRISDRRRCEAFLSVFSKNRCKLLEMTAEQQDACCANAEFVTHLTGRLLHSQMVPTIPAPSISSKEYEALLDVAESTLDKSFEFFYGLFEFNPDAKKYLMQMRENLVKVEKELAAKEAYLMARNEMLKEEKKRLMEECRVLMREVARSGGGKRKKLVDDVLMKEVDSEKKEVKSGKTFFFAIDKQKS